MLTVRHPRRVSFAAHRSTPPRPTAAIHRAPLPGESRGTTPATPKHSSLRAICRYVFRRTCGVGSDSHGPGGFTDESDETESAVTRDGRGSGNSPRRRSCSEWGDAEGTFWTSRAADRDERRPRASRTRTPPPVSVLARPARSQSVYLARTGKLDHDGADGKPFYVRLYKAGYSKQKAVGENLGMSSGCETDLAKTMVRMWLRQPRPPREPAVQTLQSRRPCGRRRTRTAPTRSTPPTSAA